MSTSRFTILIEDDLLQAEWLADEINSLPDINLRCFDSEFSFLKALEDGGADFPEPTFVVIDLILRYYSPKDLEMMETVPIQDMALSALSPQKAGIRCREALLKVFPNAKVLLVTVLDDSEIGPLPEGCQKIQKGDHELDELLREFFNS